MNINQRISDLEIPCLDVVLEDIFLLAPAGHFPEQRQPSTILDLVNICAIPTEQVWQRLQAIKKISDGIILSDAAAARSRFSFWQQAGIVPALLDVRFEQYYRNDPIAGALHLPTMTTEQWRAALDVEGAAVVFSQDGRKSFSAAMWLREQGRLDTFSINIDDLRAAL